MAVTDASRVGYKTTVETALIYYLDDFLGVAPPKSSVCMEALHSASHVLETLGLPVADDKLEGCDSISGKLNP